MIFSDFGQKPYPNPGAFTNFDVFDTTGTPLDTSIGRVHHYPYPNLEEKCRNDTFSLNRSEVQQVKMTLFVKKAYPNPEAFSKIVNFRHFP